MLKIQILDEAVSPLKCLKLTIHWLMMTKCLIYLLTSKTCSKQYTGETTDQFRLRLNNYKSYDRKKLYSSILRSVDSNSLKKPLENRVNKHILASDSVKLTEFVLSNNYFEFSEKAFQQISGTAIGAKLYTPAIHPSMHVSIYLYVRSRNWIFGNPIISTTSITNIYWWCIFYMEPCGGRS